YPAHAHTHQAHPTDPQLPHHTDHASNTGTSATHTFTVSGQAPVVTLVQPPDGSATNDTTPTLSGTAGQAPGDDVTVSVKIYAGGAATGTPVQTQLAVVIAGDWSVDASPLPEGTFTAQAQQ